MAELRQVIDDLDQRLLDLLADRRDCIDRAIALKPAEGIPARIESRIADVLCKVRKGAEDRGLDPGLAETLWRALIEWSIAREEVVLGKDKP